MEHKSRRIQPLKLTVYLQKEPLIRVKARI